MKITRVHQIELSSRCDLACKYCPHPKLQRPKADMTWEVLRATLAWAKTLPDQSELSMTGMGEATLHPEFSAMLRETRAQLPHTWILLSTNGIAVSDECLEAIAETETTLFISTHRPERAGLTFARARAMGIDVRLNAHFVDSGFNWAGQIEWPNLAPEHICQYLSKGWATIAQNGDIVNCCMDFDSKHPYGNVLNRDKPTHIKANPLCDSCHLSIPK